MVLHTFNSNTQKAEVSDCLWVLGHLGLHSKFQGSQSCIVRPCSKTQQYPSPPCQAKKRLWWGGARTLGVERSCHVTEVLPLILVSIKSPLKHPSVLQNPKREIRKILGFLRCSLPEETTDLIICHTSLKKMRETHDYTTLLSPHGPPVSPFRGRWVSGRMST